jgi:hypothetical protein
MRRFQPDFDHVTVMTAQRLGRDGELQDRELLVTTPPLPPIALPAASGGTQLWSSKYVALKSSGPLPARHSACRRAGQNRQRKLHAWVVSGGSLVMGHGTCGEVQRCA